MNIYNIFEKVMVDKNDILGYFDKHHGVSNVVPELHETGAFKRATN